MGLRSRGFRAAVGALLVFVSVTILAGSWSSPASNPNAVWVAEQHDILKVSSQTGTVLHQLPDTSAVRALGVDPVRGRLWTFDQAMLRGYEPDGTLRITQSVSVSNDLKGKPARLLVEAASGAVWLVVGNRVIKFDENGNFRTESIYASEVSSAAIDQDRSELWLVTAATVQALSSDGAVVIQFVVGSNPKAIEYAPALDAIWIADATGVSRHDRTGNAQLRVERPGIERLRADGKGSVWMSDEQHVLRMDASGYTFFQVDPIPGKIVDLAADPSDGSAWIASPQELVQLTAQGVPQHRLTLRGPEYTGRVWVLGLFADVQPPTLVIDRPALDAVVASSKPSIEVTYRDAGSGVDPASLTFALGEDQLTVDCTHGQSTANCSPVGAITDGTVSLSATLMDRAGNEATSDPVTFTVDTKPPQIDIVDPEAGAALNTPEAVLRGTVSDASSGVTKLTIDGTEVAINTEGEFAHGVALDTEGDNYFKLAATDQAGNSADVVHLVVRDTIAPAPVLATAVSVSFSGTQATVTGAAGSVEPGAYVRVTNTRTGETVVVQAGADGSFIASIAAQPGDLFEIVLEDRAGNRSEKKPISSGGLPPDPNSVAPALDTTVATNVYDSSRFLYMGAVPIQTGMEPSTIERVRAAVLRGNVRTSDDTPLAGVKITVHGHSEYGQTLTRTDGMFDLVVNGGNTLTVSYQKDGYFPVQRKIEVPWQDYAWASDVVMLKADEAVTTVNLAAGSMQVARGSIVQDEEGTRRATVLFPAGTAAVMTLPDGTEQQLTDLDVRATEYTVGRNGPDAMPGELPTASGYTYAVELSVDQAVSAGATRVDFSQPVSFYVENFLDFPVGEVVPSGWYDRERAAWVPSQNGRIMKVLGEEGGMVVLDVDGSGQPATDALLSELGISDEERLRLAELYQSGDVLWRVPMTHFTPWDCNYPYGPPVGARGPSQEVGTELDGKNVSSCDNDQQTGCTIFAQNQMLGEELSITGTPFKLHYQSNRAPGWRSESSVNIPVSDSTLPESLQKITVTVSVSGRQIRREFPPLPNQSWQFEWDGLDAYGRRVVGPATARITVAYEYNLVYYAAREDMFASFAVAAAATPGGRPRFIGRRGGQTVAISRTWSARLYGATNPKVLQSFSQGLWSLDVHHAYDPGDRTLHTGTGFRIGAADFSRVIERERLSFSGAHSVATKANGTLVVSETYNHRVWEVSPEGVARVIAGSGYRGFGGDGGPATEAKLYSPEAVAIAPDGRIYIADSSNHRIRMVDLDGTITTVAGTGTSGYSGDGGPAVEAQLNRPVGLAAAPDGSVYIAELNNQVVRRIGADGVITTFAGTGNRGFSGDGILATNSDLYSPRGLALLPSGELLIADTGNGRIRSVGEDGVIETVAGSGAHSFSGDGGPATAAGLNGPRDVAVGPDGSLYIADYGNARVRQVLPDGVIVTLAGNGSSNYVSVRGPSEDSALPNPMGISVGPDGSVLVVRWGSLYRILPPWPGVSEGDILIPSSGGDEVYHFDASGRHLRTIDAVTGVDLWTFGYDSSGRLSSIDDGNGNVTRIERGGSGELVAIVSPYGQRSELEVDGSGHLVAAANPAGDLRAMRYSPDGLLLEFTDPRGFTNTFTYNDVGRLVQDVRPDGGGWTLARSVKPDGYSVVEMSSAEGRVTVYDTEKSRLRWERAETFTTRHPDGTSRIRKVWDGGHAHTVEPDGTSVFNTAGPDPRFGMLAPESRTQTVALPSRARSRIESEYLTVLATPSDPLSHERLEEITRINGRSYSNVYEAGSRTWTRTTPEGRVSAESLDERGRISSQSFGGLAPLNYLYDDRGRLSQIVQGEGEEARSTQLTYHGAGAQAGWLAGVTDAIGRTAGFEYDAAGRVTRQTFPDGREVRLSYDSNGNLAALIPPGRSAHVFEYTPVDLEAEYNPPDVGLAADVTRYSYNLDKQLTAITRPDGDVIAFTYDAGGRLSHLDFLGGSVAYAYAPATGQLAGSTTADGVGLNFTYDGFLPTSETWSGPISGKVQYWYGDNFWPTRIFVNSSWTALQYDKDGLLVRAGDLSIQRDAATGLVRDTQLGQVRSMRDHNSFGELQAVEVPGLSGNLSLSLDHNPVTADMLDVTGTVTNASRVVVNGVEMKPDAGGVISGQIALNLGFNDVTVRLFDGAGSLSQEKATTVERTAPETGVNISELVELAPSGDLYYIDDSWGAWRLVAGSDTADQPAWLLGAHDVGVDAAGRVHLLKGSSLSRFQDGVEINVADLSAYGTISDLEAGSDGVVYFYASPSTGSGIYRVDLAGNVSFHASLDSAAASSGGDSGTAGAAFVVIGDDVQLDASTWGLVARNGEVFYRVQEDGSVSEYFRAGSFSFYGAMAVDSVGRVCYLEGSEVPYIRCRAPTGETTEVAGFGFSVTGLGFDGANRLYVGTSDNVYLDDSGSRTALIAGAQGAEIRGTLQVGGDAGQGLYQAEYVRDAIGRIIQKTEAVQNDGHVFDYDYDLAGRLVTVKKDGAIVSSSTYDPNGNRLTHNGTAATYDAQDRLLEYGDASYTYTANGELATKTDSDGVTTYTYDALGNLRQVALPSGAQIEYVIDGRNRRIGKKVDGVLVQGFLYKDQLNPVAELDGSGNVVSTFVYGTKANVPDYIIRDGVRYRIVSDHLGSPRLVINAETKAVAQRIDYDEFGRVLLDTTPGFQPFGFAGGLYDGDTELVRFGARDYDAQLGRWVAKDPILFNGGDTNLYGYVVNDPVNFIDPHGLLNVNPNTPYWGGAGPGGVGGGGGGGGGGGPRGGGPGGTPPRPSSPNNGPRRDEVERQMREQIDEMFRDPLKELLDEGEESRPDLWPPRELQRFPDVRGQGTETVCGRRSL